MWRRRRVTTLASLLALALALMALSGFTTRAGAAPSKYATQPFQGTAPATGVNAPLAGTQPLAKGLWDAKNYRIPHPAASCPQPPQSVQGRLALVNAPVALQNFGLPSLAIYHGDIAKWTDVVSHMQTRTCDFTTPIEAGHPIINQNWTYSSTYSGFGSLCATQCHHFAAADMKIVDPGVVFAAQNEVVSNWVGVGGTYNNEALSQDGTVDNTYAGFTWDNAFFETVACPGWTNAEQDAYATGAGESFYFYTDVNGTDYLDDFTTNHYFSKGWGCGTNDSAEFIQERVSCGTNCLKQLANFGTLTFHNAEWTDADGSSHDLYDTYHGGGIFQWVLKDQWAQYMITFPSWPVSDTGYGSTWEGVFQHGT